MKIGSWIKGKSSFTLPTTYDDSLSYYEQVSKILTIVEEIRNEIANLGDTYATIEQLTVAEKSLSQKISTAQNLAEDNASRIEGLSDVYDTVQGDITTLKQTTATQGASIAKNVSDINALSEQISGGANLPQAEMQVIVFGASGTLYACGAGVFFKGTVPAVTGSGGYTLTFVDSTFSAALKAYLPFEIHSSENTAAQIPLTRGGSAGDDVTASGANATFWFDSSTEQIGFGYNISNNYDGREWSGAVKIL